MIFCDQLRQNSSLRVKTWLLLSVTPTSSLGAHRTLHAAFALVCQQQQSAATLSTGGRTPSTPRGQNGVLLASVLGVLYCLKEKQRNWRKSKGCQYEMQPN